MVTQLEGAFGVSLVADRQVGVFLVECSHVIIIVTSQTLKTVVEELDKSLFDGYVKPRAEVIANKIHEATLGGHIDWYRAPQPKGKNNFVYPRKAEKADVSSDPPLRARDSELPCGSAWPSLQRRSIASRSHAQCASRWASRGSSNGFWEGQSIRDRRFTTGVSDLDFILLPILIAEITLVDRQSWSLHSCTSH